MGTLWTKIAQNGRTRPSYICIIFLMQTPHFDGHVGYTGDVKMTPSSAPIRRRISSGTGRTDWVALSKFT